MLSPKQGWPLLRDAVMAWSADYAPSMGAALSYYTLFSIAPLLLIVISVAGWFFGEQAVRGEIAGQLQYLMGEQGARAIEGLLSSVARPKEGIIASAIGLFVLLLGATSVFGELQNALDRIWRAPARESASGLWRALRAKLLSLGMILGIAFLLMVSLVLDAVLQALGKFWGANGLTIIAQAVNMAVGFGLTTTVFAMIYKLMPRASIRWRDVWVGAAVTAILFTVGKFLIGLYIGRSAIASSFGAAGSIVVMMLWVYYSAQIFLLGAEFTWVYAHQYGSRRGMQRPGAATLVEEKVEQPQVGAPSGAAPLVPIGAPVKLAARPFPAVPLARDELPVLKRKPVASIGAAAALGAIAGVLFRLRPD